MDLQNGRNDRYYIANEWALARQRALNIEEYNGRIRIMPLAISGYDERADYHHDFPFYEKSIVNLMHTPISQFIEDIKNILINVL